MLSVSIYTLILAKRTPWTALSVMYCYGRVYCVSRLFVTSQLIGWTHLQRQATKLDRLLLYLRSCFGLSSSLVESILVFNWSNLLDDSAIFNKASLRSKTLSAPLLLFTCPGVLQSIMKPRGPSLPKLYKKRSNKKSTPVLWTRNLDAFIGIFL